MLLHNNELSPDKATRREISYEFPNFTRHIFILENELSNYGDKNLYLYRWLVTSGTEIDVYTPVFCLAIGEPEPLKPYQTSSKITSSPDYLATGSGIFYPRKFPGEHVQNDDILYVTFKEI